MPRSSVVDALLRVRSLVARGASAWTVGGEPADEGADALSDALYARWYTVPATPPPPARDDPPLYAGELTSAFRAAHARAGELSGGWTVTGADPRGAISATCAEDMRLLRPGEYVMPGRPGVPPAPGEQVEPIARLDGLDPERGLWWAFTRQPEPPLGRLYFNARPATAPRALHEITAALGDAPFQLKCPIDPRACERVDAIVVYHERAAREALLAAVAQRWPAIGPLLDPAIPPLTCEVEPGFAWADDTGDGRSYGESRCRALAAALDANASAWTDMTPDARLAVLVAGLAGAGLDPERPWVAVA